MSSGFEKTFFKQLNPDNSKNTDEEFKNFKNNVINAEEGFRYLLH